MTHTQQSVLDYLERNGPVNLSRIARSLGMAPKTAAAHLNVLYREGRCHATGRGPHSRWKLGPRLDGPATVTRGDAWHPIWQCPSVWAYAERLRAA